MFNELSFLMNGDHSDHEAYLAAKHKLTQVASEWEPGQGYIIRDDSSPRGYRAAGCGKRTDGSVWVDYGWVDYAYRGPLRGSWVTPW